MNIKKLVADVATLFTIEDAELTCEDYEKLPAFEVRSDGEKNILVSDNDIFAIPFTDSSVSQSAQDIISYALSVNADDYVAKCINQGKKHRNGISSFYNEAVEHSAFVLGIGATLAMIGGLPPSKSTSFDYSYALKNGPFDGDIKPFCRFFFDEKSDAVQIVLPFPFRFRRDIHHNFELYIQKKESQDSATLAIGQYLCGDSRDERILKQLMSEYKSTAMPVLLAAKTWIYAYLGALVTALYTADRFRRANEFNREEGSGAHLNPIEGRVPAPRF